MPAYEAVLKIQDCYGAAGKKFIEAIQAMEDPIESLKAKYAEFRDAVRDAEYTEKNIGNITALALGDYYASQFVFEDDEETAHLEALLMASQLVEASMRSSDTDPIQRAWEWIKDWIIENRAHFAEAIDHEVHRYGYERNAPDPVTGRPAIYIIPKVLQDALKAAGFNGRKVIGGLADSGKIVGNQDTSQQHYAALRSIHNEKMRFYVIDYTFSKAT
jgi:hypothetical protein